MKKSPKVSRQVHLEVSSDFTQISSASKRNRNTSKRSSGLYLVRSGNSYLFQIKVPKRIGGKSNRRPIRISLGALSAQDARWLADRLAAVARGLFREIERRMCSGDTMNDFTTTNGTADDEADNDFLWSFLTTTLKAAMYDIRNPVPELSEDDARKFEAWRDLISISREVAAKQEGRQHNSLIADNAVILAASAAKKFEPLDDPTTVPVMVTGTQFTESDHLASAATTISVPAPKAIPITALPSMEPPNGIPAFKQDRRTVVRPSSEAWLLSTMAAEYFALREANTELGNKDIGTARFRVALFIELIGDHPCDTYTVTDLQAYIDLIKYWPAEEKERSKDKSARAIIEENADLHLKPLAKKTMSEGYLTIVKSVLAHGERTHSFKSQVRGAQLKYPKTSARSVPSEPLAYEKIASLLLTGVRTGFLDNAMLPLLGLLTGRRLGLLIHLKGTDIREQYKGVWVAQTSGVTQTSGVWVRVPIKTDASTTFFVLHEFLVEIGFVKWASSLGDRFIFQELIRLDDPSKSASSYMGRLFKRAGIKDSRQAVFHSLRGGYIGESRDQDIDVRDRKLQVGQQVGADDHEIYGFSALSQKMAKRISTMNLNPEIDVSFYRDLDFKKMDAKKRTRGRAPKED